MIAILKAAFASIPLIAEGIKELVASIRERNEILANKDNLEIRQAQRELAASIRMVQTNELRAQLVVQLNAIDSKLR